MFGQCCFEEGDVKCSMGTGTFVDVNTGTTPHASMAGQSEGALPPTSSLLCRVWSTPPPTGNELSKNLETFPRNPTSRDYSHDSPTSFVALLAPRPLLFAGFYPLVGWKIGDECTFIAEGLSADTGRCVDWLQSLGVCMCACVRVCVSWNISLVALLIA